MNEKLYAVMNVVRFIGSNAKIKVHRSLSDFLADRIVQAVTEPTLLAAIERLAKLMDADLGELYTSSGMEFLRVSGESEAAAILQWLREYPRVAAMIAVLPKKEQVVEACNSIVIESSVEKTGKALPQGEFDIKIKMTLLAPLAHGADMKAGNATLFRRMQVLSDTNSVLNLPYYAGNAFRGEMRDALADHFLQSLGITASKSNPKIALWFFHSLYAGGALEEDSKAAKALGQQLGGNGAVKAEGIYRFRDTLPALSLLGCALGNRILPGRVKFSDYRPECIEWGNGTLPSAQLMEWTYLTRREDFEGHEDGENKSMIANCECLRIGSVLHGGIDTDSHISELERAALGYGLKLMQDKGIIGAESRRGFGKVAMEIENAPDYEVYVNYLNDNIAGIMAYLEELGVIGALC